MEENSVIPQSNGHIVIGNSTLVETLAVDFSDKCVVHLDPSSPDFDEQVKTIRQEGAKKDTIYVIDDVNQHLLNKEEEQVRKNKKITAIATTKSFSIGPTEPFLADPYFLEDIRDYEYQQYSHLSRKQQNAEIQPVRNSLMDPKIDRNSICSCGSGKKYKKCCGKN